MRNCGLSAMGQKEKKLENEAMTLGIKDSIKFLAGKIIQTSFILKPMHFLLTSNYEGWGMAVVEAASLGLPIIMTDVGCAGELIKNKESGIVIPVNNQSKLEEAMIRIINDENLRKELIEGALFGHKKLAKQGRNNGFIQTKLGEGNK